MLLEAYGEYNISAALNMAINDLMGLLSEEDRFDYIGWLNAVLEENRLMGQAGLRHVEKMIGGLDTSRWSFLSRGYLGIMVENFLSIPSGRVSSIFDRSAIGLIRLFNSVRLAHMGSLIRLPLLFCAGYLFLLLLSFVMKKPAGIYTLADDLALLTWVISAGLTSHTHFSGHESIGQRFRMALLFFGTFLFFIVISIAIRI